MARQEVEECMKENGEYVQRSWWWYIGPIALNVYMRLGWYVSLGLHIGLYDPWDVEVHFMPFIVMVCGRKQAEEMEEQDRYHLEGVEI